jgi:hypothetical protein
VAKKIVRTPCPRACGGDRRCEVCQGSGYTLEAQAKAPRPPRGKTPEEQRAYCRWYYREVTQAAPRLCAYCKKPFEHPNQQTIYCTAPCAHTAHAEKGKARKRQGETPARTKARKRRVRDRFMARWYEVEAGEVSL